MEIYEANRPKNDRFNRSLQKVILAFPHMGVRMSHERARNVPAVRKEECEFCLCSETVILSGVFDAQPPFSHQCFLIDTVPPSPTV
jgi:hypothetical protein